MDSNYTFEVRRCSGGVSGGCGVWPDDLSRRTSGVGSILALSVWGGLPHAQLRHHPGDIHGCWNSKHCSPNCYRPDDTGVYNIQSAPRSSSKRSRRPGPRTLEGWRSSGDGRSRRRSHRDGQPRVQRHLLRHAPPGAAGRLSTQSRGHDDTTHHLAFLEQLTAERREHYIRWFRHCPLSTRAAYGSSTHAGSRFDGRDGRDGQQSDRLSGTTSTPPRRVDAPPRTTRSTMLSRYCSGTGDQWEHGQPRTSHDHGGRALSGSRPLVGCGRTHAAPAR